MNNFNDHRYLVIARVGDNSLHQHWLTPHEHKKFDLCLSYYGNTPNRFKDECEYYFESKGAKWPIIKEVIANLGDKIKEYDAVWIPDDDILTNAKNINKMFQLFIEQGFVLAQPSLSEDSYYSHKITLVQNDYLWRYGPFVEIMVPIFSSEALEKCLHTFDICQSGWGIDLLWPKILGYPYKQIALIDATPVKHTRPVGSGPLYNGLSPLDELADIERRYNVDWLTYQSVHYDGALKPRRMFFVILAHENEHLLEVQINNIRRFNPNAGIIVYNGGSNEEFSRNLNVPICPYSRPIRWAGQARVLWDVMKWLYEANTEYEYLISFDHDMIFIKYGFEQFLDFHMIDYDCMGWQMLEGSDIINYPDPRVPVSLWEEWNIWGPLFKLDNFLRYFNPGQVFRRGIINKMISFILSSISERKLDYFFRNTRVYAFEEMFSVTLAKASHGRCREYPDGHSYNEAVRWGENITIDEVKKAIEHPSYFWIHPVKGNSLLEINNWILSDNLDNKKKKYLDHHKPSWNYSVFLKFY